MSRYYGKVGFTLGSQEIRPGVYKELITERYYKGDVMKRRQNWENGTSINDNFKIANQISILADEYAEMNLYAIKYAEWMGTKWKVSSIEVERPRMIITLGGPWTEESSNKENGEEI